MTKAKHVWTASEDKEPQVKLLIQLLPSRYHTNSEKLKTDKTLREKIYRFKQKQYKVYLNHSETQTQIHAAVKESNASFKEV